MSEWKNCTLGDLGEVVGGGTPSTKKPEYYGGDIAWITPKDLSTFSGRFIKHGERNITEEGLKGSSARLMPKNTILFSSRAPIGYVAIAENEVSTNQGFKSIVPNDDTDYLFLYYLLKFNKDKIENMGSGTTFKEVSGKTVKAIDVTVPSNKEKQHEIAKILGSLDDKIENNRKINHHLAEILQVNLTQQLNEFHEKYRIGDLDLTVSDHVANGSFKSLKENVELVEKPDYALFLRNVDLKNKLNGDRRYVTESSYKFLKKSRLYGHEVIISNVADVGSVHRVPKMNMPMVAGNNVVFLQADNGLLTDYLYVYFNSRLGQHDIESITSGSAQQKFNKTDFRNLEIPILNDEIIHTQITPLLRYMDNINGEISRLIELRDSLLPKLMSGEISVTV
ncbi:putative type-1 restriction enzyme specificity protein MG438 [Streptococcus dysgalactiae]|uniref:restriction endonuclease subunit S n=1 Tax=Streptococcus dysgalactiae TaxID=1334 RepID=UPI000DCAC8F4|nr:restriction endonuclease subunit S [Streptococcus dysgalactiae]BBE39923.1 putative type-1 restriction enzyme specificity protein MG438 [Streptococcus dysgalactiae]